MLRRIKKLLKPLAGTPLHPQWFIARNENRIRELIRKEVSGPVVLDVGCGEGWPAALLPKESRYWGLDYPETAAWYETKPDVFGDATALPFVDHSIDTVLMLDVLEHLSQPRQALLEARRCLKENGILILIVPFLYPIHDAPYDYRRWTINGLRQLAGEQGFDIVGEAHSGNPLETAALLSNIGMVQSIFNWVSQRHPALLLALAFPFHVLFNNLWAWTFSRISRTDALMPISYQLVLKVNKGGITTSV